MLTFNSVEDNEMCMNNIQYNMQYDHTKIQKYNVY
jgi:hypothetical protein